MNIFPPNRSADWLDDISEPTDAELSAIESEWPVIEAELFLLDAELASPPATVTTAVVRRVRRTRRRVLTATPSTTMNVWAVA